MSRTSSLGAHQMSAQSKRKEKARIAARARRGQEAKIIMDMANELMITQEKLRKIDKATIVRLAIDYIRAFEVLCRRSGVELKLAGDQQRRIDGQTAVTQFMNESVNRLLLSDDESRSKFDLEDSERQDQGEELDEEPSFDDAEVLDDKRTNLNNKSEIVIMSNEQQLLNFAQDQEVLEDDLNSGPKLSTDSIFAPKTGDMSSHFLLLSSSQDSGLVPIPDEQVLDDEDLTHLAPQAGGVSISLDVEPIEGIDLDTDLFTKPGVATCGIEPKLAYPYQSDGPPHYYASELYQSPSFKNIPNQSSTMMITTDNQIESATYMDENVGYTNVTPTTNYDLIDYDCNTHVQTQQQYRQEHSIPLAVHHEHNNQNAGPMYHERGVEGGGSGHVERDRHMEMIGMRGRYKRIRAWRSATIKRIPSPPPADGNIGLAKLATSEYLSHHPHGINQYHQNQYLSQTADTRHQHQRSTPNQGRYKNHQNNYNQVAYKKTNGLIDHEQESDPKNHPSIYHQAENIQNETDMITNYTIGYGKQHYATKLGQESYRAPRQQQSSSYHVIIPLASQVG